MLAITRTIVNRPGAVLLVFFALFVISVFMTGLIEFEQDIFKVLPQKGPVFKVLVHALKTSTAQNKLFFLLREPNKPERLLNAGTDLIRDLEAIKVDGKPAFESVSFQKTGAISSGGFHELLAMFLKRPELFLTQEDLHELSDHLSSSGGLEGRIKRSLALLATPGARDLARIVATDPLNLRRFLIEKLQSMHQGLEFSPGTDLLSPDRRTLLIIATPAHPPGDHKAARLLLNKIDQIRTARPNLEIGITGGYAIAAQEEALVRGDILGCLVGSVVGVGLLFFFVYRNPVVLCFVLLPLGVGLQLALGVMSITCNQIHLLATAFATVVLGLGIDFAVHVYDRYAMERQAGASLETSVEKSVLKTGSAVLVGCLTTLTAFLVLTLTESPILHQIGWLVSLGLFFCLVTIALALPACLVWLEKRWDSPPKRSMLLLGTDRLGGLVSNHPKTFLIISLAIVLAAFPGIFRLKFEKNLSALRPQGLEALDVQEDLLESFGSNRQYVMASWTARDVETFWEKGRSVDRALEKLKKVGIVRSWSSLGRISSEKPPHVKGISLGAIKELFEKYGLDLEQFRETCVFLEAVSGTRKSSQEEDANISRAKTDITSCSYFSTLPDIFKRFYICENDLISGIAWIMVSGETEVLTLRDELAESCEGLSIVSPGLAIDELVREVRSELKTTVVTAAVLIIGILLMFFRRLSILPFVLMPVILGICVTAGIMGWAEVNLNPFNFIVLPILIGIGLDDGIHIYRRYQEIGDIGKTLATTGRSVLVTTLTTMCGFGSLSMADYHVLKSMGIMAIVGVVACFVFSVITLPAILTLRGSR
ncbi:MAG: MMPL family transporter [Deltaproteobacteria bacterium]|nr:MMPL family transporter [Deltaproteobacteria bacterium]